MIHTKYMRKIMLRSMMPTDTSAGPVFFEEIHLFTRQFSARLATRVRHPRGGAALLVVRLRCVMRTALCETCHRLGKSVGRLDKEHVSFSKRNKIKKSKLPQRGVFSVLCRRELFSFFCLEKVREDENKSPSDIRRWLRGN